MTKVNFAAARERAEEAELIKGGGLSNKTLKNGDNADGTTGSAFTLQQRPGTIQAEKKRNRPRKGGF